ncbi:MAG TPA: hypothetical protein VFH11_13940 [Gemmatimonadota bacterium]|nr:hypothetical protein [Gemmatimonadota bacterium]
MNVRIILSESLLLASLLSFGLLMSCSNDSEGPTDPIERVATTGSVELTIEETGSRPDTDGYDVTISLATQGGPLVRSVQQGGGPLLVADLPLGRHLLRIEGLAAHCSVTGTHPRSFLVEAGRTTKLAVGVSCPGPGAVLVKTVTRGRDVGAGPYTVTIAGETTQTHSIGTNDSLLIAEEDLPAGARWRVRLNVVPDNCWVNIPPEEVRPLRGLTFRIEYEVACIPRSSQMAYRLGNEIYLARGMEALSLSSGFFAPALGSSLSPDRSRVVFSTPGDPVNEGPALILVNADGTGTKWLTSDDAPVFVGPQAWSPAGSRIVFWKAGESFGLGDIYVMNADGGGAIRLTHDGMNTSPAWSPDGTTIAFCKAWVFDAIDVYFDIYRMNAVDGSGATEVVKNSCDPAWSPDGSRIAFTDFSLFQVNPDIAVVRTDGSGFVRLHPPGVISDQQASRGPVWSPDGSQIAYSGGRTGSRIWIVDISGSAFGEAFPYRFGSAPSWR